MQCSRTVSGDVIQAPEQDHRGRRRRLLVLGMFLALSGMVVAACGSSGSSGTDASGALKVRIMPSGGGCCQDPGQFLWQTTFKEPSVGLDVTWGPLTHGGSAVAALALSGREDVVEVSAQAAVAAAAAGRPAEIFAADSKGLWLGMAITKDAAEKLAAQGVTPSSPLADRIKALATLSITAGSPGGPREITYKSMFQAYGVDPSSVKFQFGSDDAEAAAWRSGQVDEYDCCDPETFKLRPDAVTWIKPGEIPQLNQGYYDVWMTSASYAKAHPDVLHAIVKGLAVTTKLFQAAAPGTKARSQAIATILNQDKTLDPSTTPGSFDENRDEYLTDLNPLDPKIVQQTIDIYNEGLPANQQTKLTPAQLVTPGFMKGS